MLSYTLAETLLIVEVIWDHMTHVDDLHVLLGFHLFISAVKTKGGETGGKKKKKVKQRCFYFLYSEVILPVEKLGNMEIMKEPAAVKKSSRNSKRQEHIV